MRSYKEEQSRLQLLCEANMSDDDDIPDPNYEDRSESSESPSAKRIKRTSPDNIEHSDDDTVDETKIPNKIRIHSERLKKLKEVYELVTVHLTRAQTARSHYYNLRRREWRCRVGQS